MKLTFLGGADEVGASSTLIEISGKRLLVDAGIRISSRSTRGIESDQLPDLRQISEVGGPDYLLVTHAHTDHTGALPLILEQYPHVPVIATAPTLALVRVLQADAQMIMKNRHEEEGELPLFDEIAVQRLLDAFQLVEFRQPVRLGDGLQVTYHPAGHILGAATLVIESDEGILTMSGDLSMTSQRAVVKADLPRIKSDFLVLESTYGGKLHANRLAEEKRLIETLKGVIERGGKAIIPAFALGRAQEVLQILLNFRDEIDAPVWADGMVRSVCRSYNQFRDLLPEKTVKLAGEDDLFFRKNIKAVQSPVQREEIARSEGPAIIVASSGMLTGGPSAAFVRWLADDERNAIFLTGYQDEESPGRFVQRMVKERQEGKEVTLRIDNTTVTLRCEIGTYSLSAHADDQELVNIADSLGAEHVALVHGDPGARSTLAAHLRERGKHVHMPVSGRSIEMKFSARPWALGTLKKGGEARPLDPALLWESLKESAGSYFSARELAIAWWGDENRASEANAILETDGVYFAADWRRTHTYKVRSEEQVKRTQRQRGIMAAYPDIVGKIAVLRDVNGKPRVGIVEETGIDSFKATALKAKGRNYPGDALLWIIGKMDDAPKLEGKGRIATLNAMLQQAEAIRDKLLPFDKRQTLVRSAQPIDPTTLMPANLPEDVHPMTALLAVVLSLAKDGASNVEGKLLPMQAQAEEPMEMNIARKTAVAAFPPEARLRKAGMDILRKQLTLYFDFPNRATELYNDQVEMLAELTKWEVVVSPDVNQQALGTALIELLPAQAQIVKGPSFFIDKGEVGAEINGLSDPAGLVQAYENLTGFRLALNTKGENNALLVNTGTSKTTTSKTQMEINAAYKAIKDALGPYGLYKTSLKQGTIVLSFISPQVGSRHLETIQQLADQTGYELAIHPHPNQNAILQVAQQLVRQANLAIRKGPSIHVDRGEVAFVVTGEPDESDVAQIQGVFEETTGYKLVITA
ncbi:MAG: MBL fold metallo-hydrolase [Chloroflexi bacterium]|nr:MBL fold metallo-hydrolase [Chloroflexota bacterium]